ncbi:hypothetical protein [Leptospira inadai]|uniref:hypothetical protein n=1 Tax=Leptospira inadai TaxID=29506 RepID=UPI000288C818|nr:hypothetical protein [Leptospira inadai]
MGRQILERAMRRIPCGNFQIATRETWLVVFASEAEGSRKLNSIELKDRKSGGVPLGVYLQKS